MTASAGPVGVLARGWGWQPAGRSTPAVAGVDLAVAPGERILLLGPSGAGKSTLLRGLAGVLGGDEDGHGAGALELDGRPVREARGRAGLVLQDPDAQVVLARVGDDVAFACENLGVPRAEIWPRVAEALDAVGLADLGLDRSTSALSGGQKQRLALAAVLAMRPGLVLLDEPTANLDPAGALDVRDAVLRSVAASGATLVVVEHRVELWADRVDRVVVLGPDGVRADGEPDAVFAAHGEALSAAGVWVPRAPLPAPRRAAAEGPVLLTAEALDVGHRGRRGRRTPPAVAAAGVGIDLAAGTILAVTGPNGAGKSTLAWTLAGLREPLGGRVVAEPALRDDLGPDPARWRSSQLLPRIGAVFQEPEHQLVASRVRDELAVGLRALRVGDAEIARRLDPLLERLRLAHLADAHPFTLSGGEKRRLTVAAALATRPRVLILDEPTYGQDARTWRELVDLLGDLREGGTAIVAVTHDEPLVEALADRRHALAGVAA